MTNIAVEKAQQIKRIGIVGGGLIGLSWASLYMAYGYDVVVYDTKPETEREIGPFVENAFKALKFLGIQIDNPSAVPQFTTSTVALADVDFVQENGPDRVAIKQKIVAELEQVVGPNIPIASSTSSLTASEIQATAANPWRIFVAHPMNPPHMVPLVELAAGSHTAPQIIDLAEAFYRGLDRVTIRVRKEVVGHIANRLTSALYREAVYMASEGIATIEDIDRAVCYGPGIRWALMGPHLIYHLGGGPGGYRHYLDHLGPTQERRWLELGTAPLTPELKDLLVDGMDAELVCQDRSTLTERRDLALAEILAVKRNFGF